MILWWGPFLFFAAWWLDLPTSPRSGILGPVPPWFNSAISIIVVKFPILLQHKLFLKLLDLISICQPENSRFALTIFSTTFSGGMVHQYSDIQCQDALKGK